MSVRRDRCVCVHSRLVLSCGAIVSVCPRESARGFGVGIAGPTCFVKYSGSQVLIVAMEPPSIIQLAADVQHSSQLAGIVTRRT